MTEKGVAKSADDFRIVGVQNKSEKKSQSSK